MILAELNQSLLKGGQRLGKKRLQEVLDTCARALRIKKSLSISIGFVSARQMRTLNKAWRGKDRVTDVLSFELNEGEMKGELILNYEQAVRQARTLNHGVHDELYFLIVHGVLHVFGFDHEQPDDAQKMFALQTKILTSLGIDSRL